jgi:hypothetical protein
MTITNDEDHRFNHTCNQMYIVNIIILTNYLPEV